ncbi:carbohydrate kinase [Proteinivorax hydrogeniformans]|uniref:Carbohydrate kinase n=1 Tax=Proteinivorax hydrogeniformans TaxID=1826727 RepID=A0AAU8HRV6_9FIRM
MENKVYTIGEALIDFIPDETGVALKDVKEFKRVMGGAPANVAVAVAKLGGKSAFISKLGRDSFGEHIIDTLKANAVNTNWVFKTDEANTGLAFVSLQKDGQRDFSFYRNPSADMLLTENDVDDVPLTNNDILHFCSVDLIDAPVKKAHRRLIEAGLNSDTLISFDPNVRLPLWPSHTECKNAILEFLPYAHILKISDDELEFITGINDADKAIQSLFVGNVQWVVYTLGSKGATIITRDNKKVTSPSFLVKACDTTGAGDAFIGALLYKLSENKQTINSLKNISSTEMTKILQFCNGYAALTTTRSGAVDALSSLDETVKFINRK